MSSFRDYIQHGWALCNIPPGSKGPVGEAAKGWQKRERAITNPDYRFQGAGLLHAWSGTCAVDIDNFEVARDWLAERGVDLQALLTDKRSVQITSGRPGRYKLIYLLPEPLPSKKLAPYKGPSKTDPAKEVTYHGFELRCANANGESVQDVLPPTIHPETTRPYEWAFGDEIFGDWRQLPLLPEKLASLWKSEIALAAPVGPVAAAGADRAEISKLLAGRDPDAPYDGVPGSWIETGSILHHESRGEAWGFEMWDAWSSRGTKYKGRDDLVAHWKSFRADAPNAVTLGSLRRERVADTAEFPVAPPAETPPPASTGWDLVRETLEPRLVFVTGHDQYFDLKARGEPWLSDRSIRHMFCPFMPKIEDGVDKKGNPKIVTPDPVVFMQMSRSKKTVDAVGIHPGADRFYKEDGMRFVNRYRPEVVEPLTPKPHEEDAFLALWAQMKDPIFQKWLMKFYAHALQKPGVKIQTAPLLFSNEQGTGKNTIAHVIPQLLFGAPWVRTITGNVLSGSFNDTVGATWWLYLEELRAGVTKPERIALTNKIKSWVTDSHIEIHPKGLKPYNVRNRIQITATTNFDDALQLDNNDRRWAVCEMEKPLTEQAARDIYYFLSDPRAPGVLRYIFGKVDLAGFSPTARAPMTGAKKAMIRAGIGQWESQIVEHMLAGRRPFDKDIFRLQDAYDALVGRGPVSQHALRSILVKAPFNCEQLPNGREMRLYAWRNKDQWAKVPEGLRLRYLDCGQRPGMFEWSDEPPEALAAMSAEGPPDKPPVCDLI